jgi:hypothetical protein
MLSKAEVDAIYAAAQRRQVQCPRCHAPVFLNQWASFLNLCAECVQDQFGLELQEDGSYRLTPEREARRLKRLAQTIEQEKIIQLPRSLHPDA